jgi:hypothetical protein
MIFITLLFAAMSARAYIPEYGLIASHAADQHGKGAYVIEQEVSYRKDGEVFSVKESWLVTGENNLRLTLEGRGPLKGLVRGTILFEGSQKFFVEEKGPVRSQHLGEDWVEPLFHFRYSRYLRSRLVNLKVAPPESLRDRAPLSADGEPQYQAPGFIRLSRVGGAIAWAISLSNAGDHPTAWIEQDQFVLRKFRGADQFVLRADDYGKFDEGFWFPRKRTYTFGDHTVEVHTLQVRPAGKIPPSDARFRSSNLNAARDALKLPDADVMKEFYSRFR